MWRFWSLNNGSQWDPKDLKEAVEQRNMPYTVRGFLKCLQAHTLCLSVSAMGPNVILMDNSASSESLLDGHKFKDETLCYMDWPDRPLTYNQFEKVLNTL